MSAEQTVILNFNNGITVKIEMTKPYKIWAKLKSNKKFSHIDNLTNEKQLLDFIKETSKVNLKDL